VLLALRRGDTVNRQARTDWTAADWETWAGIDQVWLGGGIVSGRLGAVVAQAARRYLADAGAEGHLSVSVDPYAPLLEDHIPATDIMISIAAYVQGGRLLGNGIYAQMHFLADDIRPILARAIFDRTGQPVQIHLIHDGTAAAAVHAGERNSAVIIVGTALGVGFPPAETAGLHPLRLDQGMVSESRKPIAA
jgi:hypothetical protein